MEILTSEKENYVPSSNDLSHLEAQYEMKIKDLQLNHERATKELKSNHFKQLQDLKLQGRQNFEKTLSVANSVISVDSAERKKAEEKTKQLINEKDAKCKDLEEESQVVKQQLSDVQSELTAFRLQTDEEKRLLKTECDERLEAQRVAFSNELIESKMEFLRIFEAELECQICSEYYIQPSILTTCSHVFCHTCIVNWVRTRAPNVTCPICRTPHTEQNIKAFPLGQCLIDKMEDKLPHDVATKRQGLVEQRRQNRI